MTGTTRWAIVGTGGIARRVLQDLRLTENVEVVAAGSRTQETADRFCAETGVPRGYGDYDELLRDPDVDLVYICTPHPMHADYARRAILARKHVLVEKPMTMSVADAVELRDLAAEHDVFLMEALWTRFNPNFRRALAIAADGQIGELRLAQTGMGFPVPASGPKRFWDPALGGGALWDLGVYTLSIVHAFLGSPRSISAAGEVQGDGVDRWEAVTLDYEGGGVAVAVSSIVFAVPPTASIGGTKGTLVFSGPFFSPTGGTVTLGRPLEPPRPRTSLSPSKASAMCPCSAP
ncbi:Gfo/Idh/MocA family protein [Naasia aerilata]|uniref:Oxidoreductase n=1 Tax=Naasia aerilata TaxID=1162966 RepID=A0ABM8GH81_9MICO|nr:Gfo/Idh/MocA family oxidoreductase [Naasia aerilata]BDZ44094.1 putative oxidoreductase [Naasia aerilata]BDZ47706.1 putative oxidoreductase [Naasia aerilata]